MDPEYLETHVWIYAHASDLDQGVVLWGIDFFAVVTIKNSVWRWSNKLQQTLFENTKTSDTSKNRI